MKYRIQKWDPATLKPNRKMLFVGRSGGGKSVAMRNLLYEIRSNVDLAIMFTPTETTKQDFLSMVPASCLYDTLDLSVVDRALTIQKELGERGKERSVLLCADDCAFDKSIWRSSTVRALFMNARHHRISVCVSAQYLMDFEPSLRSNVDYLFCTAENIHQNKKRLWQAFFGVFKTYNEFDQVFTACTRDFSVCVLDQTQPSATIANSVYWWKASPTLPPFRLGRPIFFSSTLIPPEKKEDHKSVQVI